MINSNIEVQDKYISGLASAYAGHEVDVDTMPLAEKKKWNAVFKAASELILTSESAVINSLLSGSDEEDSTGYDTSNSIRAKTIITNTFGSSVLDEIYQRDIEQGFPIPFHIANLLRKNDFRIQVASEKNLIWYDVASNKVLIEWPTLRYRVAKY
jgi:hypothetical protein